MSKYTQVTLNRRDFITFSAMAAAMLGLSSCVNFPKDGRTPRKPRPLAPGAKVRIAQIGCGGKGFSDIMAHEDEDVVALCDIDWEGQTPRAAASGNEPPKLSNVKKLIAKFPNAKRYTDFRKMLIDMDDQIDAVGIATPDHMHFLPAYMAIMTQQDDEAKALSEAGSEYTGPTNSVSFSEVSFSVLHVRRATRKHAVPQNQ